MTKARIQQICRAKKINIGYFDGTGGFPRSVTKRSIALYLHKNHFCLVWKSENVSFNQTIKELKNNFEKIDNYLTEENVNSHFNYEFTPKKIESHLTDFIVYDLETHNGDKAIPYHMTFYRLSKLTGRRNRDLTPKKWINVKRTL